MKLVTCISISYNNCLLKIGRQNCCIFLKFIFFLQITKIIFELLVPYITPTSQWNHSIVLCGKNAPTCLLLLCQWVQIGRES